MKLRVRTVLSSGGNRLLFITPWEQKVGEWEEENKSMVARCSIAGKAKISTRVKEISVNWHHHGDEPWFFEWFFEHLGGFSGPKA